MKSIPCVILGLCSCALFGCGAYEAFDKMDSTQGYSAITLVNPISWFIPYKPNTPENPYSKGDYSEQKDLKEMWDKSGDGVHSTPGACAAAARVFRYGSFRQVESARTIEGIQGYLGRAADLVQNNSAIYVFRSTEATTYYTLILEKTGIGVQERVVKTSTRTKK